MAARLRSLLGRLAPATIAESRSLAARLPGLLVEAREVAGAVAAGWHGRRQAGIGEDFWQFRPFESGEPVRGIDWRRSARGDTLYVREHERQNAHTVWLAVDVSASMAFRSDGAAASKCDRAVVLALVGVVAAGAVQVQTTEAARTAARMLARGDEEATVRDQVASALPGAQVRIRDEGPRVRVEVARDVGGRGVVPRFTIRAEVRTVREE